MGLFRFWRQHITILELLLWYAQWVTQKAAPIDWGLEKKRILYQLSIPSLATWVIRTKKPTVMEVSVVENDAK